MQNTSCIDVPIYVCTVWNIICIHSHVQYISSVFLFFNISRYFLSTTPHPPLFVSAAQAVVLCLGGV